MGRHQFGPGGHHNYKVVVSNEGQRKSYSQHDDRDGGGGPPRKSVNLVWRRDDQNSGGPNKRVSFHNDRRGGGIRKRGSGIRGRLGGPPMNVILERDDAGPPGDRGAQSGRARQIPGGVRSKFSSRGRGRGGSRGGYVLPANLVIRRALGPAGTPAGSSGLSWSRVTLESASKYPKEDVYEAIVKSLPAGLKFAPICFSKAGMNYVFFIETEAEAAALLKISRSVSMYGADSGQMLSIRVDRSPPPKINVTDEMWEKAKVVMSNRYTPGTKALDLKCFHTDPVFLNEALFVPLSRGIIIKHIVQIIEENIPEVEAIDLSDNRLTTLDQLCSLFEKAKNLKVLYLANNKISEAVELKSLKGLQLVDFKLEGNPVVNVLKDNYNSVIRKLFPSLTTLDGNELQKLITFEDSDSPRSSKDPNELPAAQMKSVCNEEAGKIVLQFLEEYFKVYDSDNRQALLDAYHENAVMSMAASYPPASISAAGMKEYTVQSRNLVRVSDTTRRQKLLHQGRLSIFAFLKDLPKTLHDPTSFTLDLPFATERLMTFTVTGLFKERESTDDAVRHFSRMFVVVPHGSGFCIVNEALFVTTATSFQIKSFYKTPLPLATQAPVVPPAHAIEAFVASLTQKTGMNATWSRKCLEETGWDISKAEIAFRNAHQEGKIPIEAFEH